MSDIAGHGKWSAWNAFCSNPHLLANLGKGDFHDETYSSYPRSSSAGCWSVLMRAAVIMASAEYLKHCHLPTSNAPQLHIQRAHYQSMVWIQATCNIPLLPPQPETMGWSKGNGTLVLTVIPLAPMCRSYLMRMHQMMHLREMWLQKLKHSLHKIVQVHRCMNNERWRCCEEKNVTVVLVSCRKLKCVCKYNNCGSVTRC